MIDREAVFSDEQVLTADAASTNYVNTQSAGRAVKEMYLVVTVGATALASSGGTGGTLAIKLQTADNSGFSGATDLVTSQSFAEAALTAGAVLYCQRLPDGLEQYLRVYYDVNDGAVFNAGTITAYLSMEPRLAYS